jgi:hypothetical protein
MSDHSDQPVLFMLVQQLQQELQNQRIEIQSLRSDVVRLQSQLSDRSAPRSRLPDPPRFNGKPLTLRTWLPSIRAKLRSDQLVGSDAFDYVWDRLEQPQQASILHLRQSAEDTQVWDVESVFSFFQRLCHNPREHQEAVQRFSSIRQREEESLIAYLARFERLTYEADASSWPDASRVTTLHHGLRPTLRQFLEESSDSLFSQSYDHYVELVQSLDRRSRRPQPVQKPASHPPPSDPMDISAVRVNAVRPTRSTSPASSVSSSTSSIRFERRMYRLENSLCLCCGADDHWISKCPKSRTRSHPNEPVSLNNFITRNFAKSATLSRRFGSSQGRKGVM